MPTIHNNVTTTSTPVTTTARSDGYFGTPFVVRHVYGQSVFNPVLVLSASSQPVTVTQVAFTTSPVVG